MIDTEDLLARLRHCSQTAGDEYLYELAGRAADEIDRLRKLAEYAQHMPGCNIWTRDRDGTRRNPCDCGLAELLTGRREE